MIKIFKALKDNSIHPVTPIKKGDLIEIFVYTAKGLPAGEIIIDDGLNFRQKNFFLDDDFYDNFIELNKYRELTINNILHD